MAIKAGDFITITKRKCSAKVQPHLKEGGIYCVASVDTLKDGTKVLVLFRDLNSTCRCNAKRFDWQRYEKRCMAKKMADFRSDVFEKKINEKCTDEENAVISFIPVMMYMVMWHYGDEVLAYCRQRKLSKFVKLSRELRDLREQANKYLEESLHRTEVTRIRNFVFDFIDEHKQDFSVLYFSMQNELMKQNRDMDHGDLYTLAFIAILMCRELYHYEERANMVLVEKNIYHSNEYHLSYRKEFFLIMTKFLEGITYDNSDHERLCMKIFERNFESITFVKED